MQALLQLACILLLLVKFQHVESVSGSGGYEIDVSWDFTNGDMGGWGNSTSEEMQMELNSINDELRCSIVGVSPNIDSPLLFIDVTRRHYIVMRMMYFGNNRKAKFLLRSGVSVSGRAHLDHKTSYWGNRLQTSALYATTAVDNDHSMEKIVDGDKYTYYSANQPAGVFITFDLGDNRWIKELRMLPVGDDNSPKRCLLQLSMTTGMGPFETVQAFTVQKDGTKFITDEIKIIGFDGHARYWRLLVIDNWGGTSIGIRELSLYGYDEQIAVVPFDIDNTGVYKNYYVPIAPALSGNLLRIRYELVPELENTEINTKLQTPGRKYREGMHIDYIRIARAPDVKRVRGCLERYFDEPNMVKAYYNVTSILDVLNNNLPMRYFTKNQMPPAQYPFATTYDCPTKGGVEITVEGMNMGPKARIYIGGNECPQKSFSYGLDPSNPRVETIVCILPPGKPGSAMVRVENGILPGLFQEVAYFSYRNAPPVLLSPRFTNVAAYRIDLVWAPPGNEFDNMMTTGYKILWFEPKFPTRISNLTVGNVTTTSVRGLKPGTEYVFAIAPMAEGAFEGSAKLPTDLYGRRDPTPDAYIGTFSPYTNVTATVFDDFNFAFFNANKTLNHSGSTTASSTGPTGMWGSEGSYGLVMVGSTNVQNCNVSSTCCDGFNATIGLASCGTNPSVCAVLPSRALATDLVIDGITRRQVGSNVPYPNGALQEIEIMTLDELIANKGAELPTSRCGPALRLTPSEARASGAAWYRRKVDVREGFDTRITFEISNPSQKCERLDDVNTYCRSRGADGFAFVIQNVGLTALGLAGSGMGYEGIFNALAVEMDTYHNYDQMDYYENHIAVMTQGWRQNLSANHTRSLATSNRVPDLSDGRHTVRIRYDPNFDNKAVPHPSFQVNGYTTNFLENADFKNGGEGDWGVGFGLLYIYIDDMYSPTITTPINLDKTLRLDSGRAYVGLTAATGDSTWQAHDILEWSFSSTYRDEGYNPPIIVNGEGAHECVNVTECVHRVEYEHYVRQNNWDRTYIMPDVEY
jgi:hypothetical protein